VKTPDELDATSKQITKEAYDEVSAMVSDMAERTFPNVAAPKMDMIKTFGMLCSTLSIAIMMSKIKSAITACDSQEARH